MTIMPPMEASPRGIAGHAIHQCRLFFTAVQFFTRLPVPRWVGFEPAWLHQSTRYFPAVGLLVGALAAMAYALCARLWPPPIAALLSTAAGIYLTGAFHEDGFADVCDGLGGGTTRERALEIMKDSRIGAYGAIGIGMMLAVKCVALSCLMPHAAIAALLAAHPLSRFAAVTLIWRLDYAREEGKAKPMAQQMSNSECLVAAATVVVVLAALYGTHMFSWKSLAAGIAATCAVTIWMARKFVRRIGGYTGDCLGAVQQVAEAAFYLAVLATLD